MKKYYLVVLTTVVLILGSLAVASPAGGEYHLLKKIPFGAAPGGKEYFDYVVVDADARRVYLTHGAEVKVLDADSFELVGTIGGLKKCHGVLVLKNLGKGFITDANEVLVFD